VKTAQALDLSGFFILEKTPQKVAENGINSFLINSLPAINASTSMG